MTEVAYDCQTCGACCYSPWTGDGYVRLYDIDLDRLDGSGLSIILQDQGELGDLEEVLPKLGTGFDDQGRRTCIAFRGLAGKQCSCTIYADRPEACRRF